MSKRIALVGHCGPDSTYLRSAVRKAFPDATVIGADNEHLLRQTLEEGADLVLLNRQLEAGYDEDTGVAMIHRLKETHPNLKMMLVSNYEDAQEAAEKAGALPGFGKSDIGKPKATERLQAAFV
ncbi:MAG: response regulator [Phycisphaerae bacterium]